MFSDVKNMRLLQVIVSPDKGNYEEFRAFLKLCHDHTSWQAMLSIGTMLGNLSCFFFPLISSSQFFHSKYLMVLFQDSELTTT